MRKFVYVGGSAFLLFFVVLTGAVVYLTTPSGSAYLLHSAKNYLERNQNTKIDFVEGRFDLLKGLYFRSLKIHREDSSVTARIAIDEITLDYEFSIWNRLLDVKVLKIKRPVIAISMQTDLAKPAVPASSDAPSGIQSLEKFIIDPPIRLVLREVSIEDLDLDANVTTAESSIVARLQKFSARAKSSFLQSQLTTSGEVHSGVGKFSVRLPDEKEAPGKSAIDASLTASLDGSWDVDIHKADGSWIYAVRPAEWKLALKQIAITQTSTEQTARVVLPEASFHAKFQIAALSRVLFKLESDGFKSLVAELEARIGSAVLSQDQAGKLSRVRIDSQKLSAKAQLADDIRIKGGFAALRIDAPKILRRSVDAGAEFSATIPRDLKSLDLAAKVNFAGTDLATLEMQSKQGLVNPISVFKGRLILKLSPMLAKFVQAASPLHSIGAFVATTQFEGKRLEGGSVEVSSKTEVPKILLPKLTSPSSVQLVSDCVWTPEKSQGSFNTRIEIVNTEIGAWLIESKLELASLSSGSGILTLTQGERAKSWPKQSKVPVALPEPLRIDHSFDLQKGIVSLNIAIPTIDMANGGQASNLRAKLAVNSPTRTLARNLDLTFDLEQGPVRFSKSQATDLLPLPIDSIRVRGHSSIQDDELAVDQLEVTVNETMLELKAKAAGNLKTKNIQGQVDLSVSMAERFSSLNGQMIKGRLQIPVSLSVFNGREIVLLGEINAIDFSWEKPPFRMSGLNGKIPISEKLIWDGQRLEFMGLILQNPFERVDFERVRPLLQSTEQFRIESMGWEEKSYGPFIGFFSVRQNMFFAHEFDMDFGAGRLSGELFFDTFPKNLQFGSLARLTNVNLSEVLPKKFLARIPLGNKPVSGRSGFVLNLNRGTMDGRVDVTEIGGPQLVALMNILDPAYEDEKFNKLRGLLEIGFPTAVALDFAEGYLDMNIGLSVLGISSQQSVRGIPISSFLSSATAGIVQQTEKGPIK